MNISVKCNRPGYPVGCNMDATKKLIDEYLRAFNKLGYSKDKILNLWCRGSSGAILAGMFALKVKNECKICHIKKREESSHNGNTQPYDMNGINIIIDDFVSFGHTIIAIVQHIKGISRYSGMGKYEHLELDVLMVLQWDEAPKEVTDRFKHKIGIRI